jgi:c-di-GMP-binding flagellar brake protein YcgR
MASSAASDTGKWRIARSFPRFAIELAAKVHLSGVEDMPPFAARMIDIGLGGACLVLQQGGLAPRQKVLLEFRFPMTTEVLRVRAAVRHARATNRYGFQFLDLQAEDRERIRRACVSLKIV